MFHQNSSAFHVILLTDRQTDRQTHKGKNVKALGGRKNLRLNKLS